MQKKAKCPSQLLAYKPCKYELQFLQKACMQKFICLSNNVHFPGILHAKESQVFHLISCLLKLQIWAPISAKRSAWKH